MPVAKTISKAVTCIGIAIAIAGSVAYSLALGGSEFFLKFSDAIFPAVFIGLLILAVGLIGWTAQLGRRGRVCMAALTLSVSVVVWLAGSLTNANQHGIFPLLFVATVPFFIIGILLGIMALASGRP
jgi:hypothetical protein